MHNKRYSHEYFTNIEVVVDCSIFGRFICIQFENYDNIVICCKHLSLLKIFKVMPPLQNTAWQNIICGSKNNILYMQCMLLTTILPSYGLMVFLIYVFNWVHGCCCMDIVLPIQKWIIIKDFRNNNLHLFGMSRKFLKRLTVIHSVNS